VEYRMDKRPPGTAQQEGRHDLCQRAEVLYCDRTRMFIMVGEIRDPETATIAVQAALTGHRVLTTVHTNDAAWRHKRVSWIWGLNHSLSLRFMLVSFAQRLVRKLCPECRVSYSPPGELLADLGA